ncbi:MAG: SNF2-related protein [Burkholderiales bacterium]
MATITVTKSSAGYRMAFPYSAEMVAAVKSLPSRRFDPQSKSWTVPTSGAAALRALLGRLNGTEIRYGDGAKEDLEGAEKAVQEAVAASRATDWQGDIPCPDGLAYLPFQRAGIAYAMARPDVLIGDEMGLGKTIQAIGACNADPSVHSVLVICPASLKINWAREWAKWSVRSMTIGIANGGALPATDVLILNYDVLKKHAAALRARTWDMLVSDECHYLKNPKAARTHQVLGKWDKDPDKRITAIAARRRLFLTGTPILNRPIELWPLVHALAPGDLGKSWKTFVVRYCAGVQDGYGWDVTGASNLEELQDRLRAAVMVRRLKADVLTELPAKRRSVVVLPAEGASAAIKAESAGYDVAQARIESARVAAELAKAEGEESYAAAVARLRDASSAAFTEISRLRHATAVAKIPQVIEYLTDVCESEKVIFFAHHLDVLRAVNDAFPGSVILTGESSQDHRQAAVDRFQTAPDCRLFVGSIKAAGVGITLTASSHVIMGELDWVPGNVTQAEDRAHRIGQTDSVLVEHLVLDGSLDVRMAQVLIAKQEIIDKALDDTERFELGAIEVTPDAPATANTSRSRIDGLAAKLTPEDIARIHAALRMLAGLDADHARQLNDMGFNRMDSRIGHDLAGRPTLTARQAALGQLIAHKYRRQLGDDAV